MLDEKQAKFDLNVWYTTKDYKDLYKIVYNKGSAYYAVIVYYTGSTMYYGSLDQVQSFMNDKCITHESYIRWCFLNGK